MTKDRQLPAGEDIPFGALVSIAQGRVWRAEYRTATHQARDRTPFDDDDVSPAGKMIMVYPLADWEVLDLQALANGRLMDPNKINLPAGKLTPSQYQQRLAEDFRRASISQEEQP